MYLEGYRMIGGVFRPQAIYRTPSLLLIKAHRECVSRSTASGSSAARAPGNPDFTNAPGHGDDDARFYDRQQAYVHARGG